MPPIVFRYETVRSGLLLFAWGMFKKLVVADRLGLYVNMVYGSVPAHTGPAFLCATYLYAFQLYFDFSGYTDMALGSARIFNINLTQNFNTPYLATSIADFWRRWHISFSRWILDYIFKPLQMKFRDMGHRRDCLRPVPDLPGFGDLAWGKLGVCDLGIAAWSLSGGIGLL